MKRFGLYLTIIISLFIHIALLDIIQGINFFSDKPKNNITSIAVNLVTPKPAPSKVSKISSPSKTTYLKTFSYEKEDLPEQVYTNNSSSDLASVSSETTLDRNGYSSLFQNDDSISHQLDSGLISSITEARPIGNIKPPYPRYCNKHKQQGEVVLEYQVDEDGNAFDIQIKKSSGYDMLDTAAIDTIKKTKFIPAMKDGIPVVSQKQDIFAFIHPGA